MKTKKKTVWNNAGKYLRKVFRVILRVRAVIIRNQVRWKFEKRNVTLFAQLDVNEKRQWPERLSGYVKTWWIRTQLIFTYESWPSNGVGDRRGASERFPVNAMLMMVIVRVIVMIDGDKTGVPGVRSFGPVETSFDEEEREHGIPVRRQPLPPLPLHVVVFYEDLQTQEGNVHMYWMFCTETSQGFHRDQT